MGSNTHWQGLAAQVATRQLAHLAAISIANRLGLAASGLPVDWGGTLFIILRGCWGLPWVVVLPAVGHGLPRELR